jgi:hypothetical protein
VPATASGDGPVEQPLVVVDETAEVEDITLEGERLREELPDAERGPEVDLDSTDEFELLGDAPGLSEIEDAERTSEQEIEEIFRALPEDAVFDDRAPVSLLPDSPTHGTESTAPAAAGAAAAEASPDVRSWRTENVRTWPDPDAGRVERMPDVEPEARTSKWRGVAWTLGSLLLALVLLAQVVHQNRQSLVRHPTLGAPVRSIYDGLGLPMLPNWNLAGFELRQWGNEPETAADGRMVVRASLRNGADFAQPHPILRLELEDRYGETVAMRDFEPGEYLKDPSQASRLIAAGASAEAELVLADPGAEAVGYRLDVCLRESAELLRCAQGPG